MKPQLEQNPAPGVNWKEQLLQIIGYLSLLSMSLY
jgi:hypothetical protein